MYTKYITVTVLVTVAAAAVVLAKPLEPRAFELVDVINKTMCPIKMVYDENPERIPRRIKFLKCDENPNPVCGEQHMPQGCCKHHHHNYVTECVEVYDWVLVSFKSSPEPQKMKVPVGCNCMISESHTAHAVP